MFRRGMVTSANEIFAPLLAQLQTLTPSHIYCENYASWKHGESIVLINKAVPCRGWITLSVPNRRLLTGTFPEKETATGDTRRQSGWAESHQQHVSSDKVPITLTISAIYVPTPRNIDHEVSPLKAR